MARRDELKQLIKTTEKELNKLKEELRKLIKEEGTKTKDGILVREREDYVFFTREDGVTVVTSAYRNSYNERDVWSAGKNWDGKKIVRKMKDKIVLKDERMAIKEVAAWLATTDMV